MDYAAFNQPAAEVREAEQQKAALEMKLDGTTDAYDSGHPKSKDPGYLDGFFAVLRRRVEEGEHLEIRWLSETYLTGGYDAPDWFTGEW